MVHYNDIDALNDRLSRIQSTVGSSTNIIHRITKCLSTLNNVDLDPRAYQLLNDQGDILDALSLRSEILVMEPHITNTILPLLDELALHKSILDESFSFQCNVDLPQIQHTLYSHQQKRDLLQSKLDRLISVYFESLELMTKSFLAMDEALKMRNA